MGASGSAPFVLGEYELLCPLVTDAIGVVHLARRRGVEGSSGAAWIMRFHSALQAEEEFRGILASDWLLASSAPHENLLLADALRGDAEVYAVGDYREGGTLAQLLAYTRQHKYRIPMGVSLRIALDALAGVEGVIVMLNASHRALAPECVFLSGDGATRVMGFGVAGVRAFAVAATELPIEPRVEYMAPEQIESGRTGPASDVYAVGEMLWEMLAARSRFDGGGVSASLKSQATVAPPSSVAPGIPAKIDAVVLRALQSDPAARFQTAGDFARALSSAGVKIASRSEVAFYLGVALRDVLTRHRDLLAHGASPVASVEAAGVSAPASAPVSPPAATPAAVPAAAPAPAKRTVPMPASTRPAPVSRTLHGVPAPAVRFPTPAPARPAAPSPVLTPPTSRDIVTPPSAAPVVAPVVVEQTEPAAPTPLFAPTPPPVAAPLFAPMPPPVAAPLSAPTPPPVAAPLFAPTPPPVAAPLFAPTPPPVAVVQPPTKPLPAVTLPMEAPTQSAPPPTHALASLDEGDDRSPEPVVSAMPAAAEGLRDDDDADVLVVPTRRPIGVWIAAGAVIVVLGVVGAFVGLRRSPSPRDAGPAHRAAASNTARPPSPPTAPPVAAVVPPQDPPVAPPAVPEIAPDPSTALPASPETPGAGPWRHRLGPGAEGPVPVTPEGAPAPVIASPPPPPVRRRREYRPDRI